MAKKILTITLCILLIISIGLNIYQRNKIISERKSNINMSKHYMRESQATFSNAFDMGEAANTEILEYIKNPEKLSNIIEAIEMAELYHLVASDYAAKNQLDEKNYSSIWSRQLILNGYLTELRSYRRYLQSNKNEPYEFIDQIAIDINDLQTISNWLLGKYRNNDFEVYNDEDFYNEVYVNLKSDIKNRYLKYFK